MAEHKENLKQMDEESKEMEEVLAKSGAEEQKRLERQQHKEQAEQAEYFKKTVSISDPSQSNSFILIQTPGAEMLFSTVIFGPAG